MDSSIVTKQDKKFVEFIYSFLVRCSVVRRLWVTFQYYVFIYFVLQPEWRDNEPKRSLKKDDHTTFLRSSPT